MSLCVHVNLFVRLPVLLALVFLSCLLTCTTCFFVHLLTCLMCTRQTCRLPRMLSFALYRILLPWRNWWNTYPGVSTWAGWMWLVSQWLTRVFIPVSLVFSSVHALCLLLLLVHLKCDCSSCWFEFEVSDKVKRPMINNGDDKLVFFCVPTVLN